MFGLHTVAGISFWLGSEMPIAQMRTRRPLLLVQYGVCSRVVVHLHLSVHLHVDAPLLNIGQQLVDSGREVYLLFQQDI